MQNKKSFILFQEYKQNLSLLSQSDKGDLLDAIFAFNDGEEVKLSPIVAMAFSFIKADLIRNEENWKTEKKERSNSGRLGNIKRWHEDLYNQIISKKISLEEAENIAKHHKTSLCDNSESLKSQEVANIAVNVNVNDNVNVNNIKKDKPNGLSKKSQNFQKPNLQEIQDYCVERKNSVNPDKFLNHYESNGWKVGKNPMKNWKAAIRKWEQSSFDNPNPIKSTSANINLVDEVNKIANEKAIKQIEVNGSKAVLYFYSASHYDRVSSLAENLKNEIKNKISLALGTTAVEVKF